MKKRSQVCQRCGARALQPSVRAARIEDIPDGNYIDIPEPICSECLERITEECIRISEEDEP